MRRVVKFLSLISFMFFSVFGCSSTPNWKGHRVQTVNGKNKRLVRKDSYCIDSRKEYDKVFSDAIRVNGEALSALKKCSLKGADDRLYTQNKKSARRFYEEYDKFIAKIKTKPKEFNSCFYSGDASLNLEKVVIDLSEKVGMMIGQCSKKSRTLLENANSPEEYANSIQKFMAEESSEIFQN